MRPGRHIEKSTEILLWVYGVGLAGMLLPFSRELFITITPLNLLFAALFLFYGRWPARRVLFTGLAVFAASFLVEAVGVNTGKIFGSYSYGSALGRRLWNTPVIIGLNWFVLIYCTNVISRQLWDLMQNKKTRGVYRSVFIVITGSLLMVLYDLFLEPAATRLDMWSWDGGRIPFSNYAAWFLFSALFHTAVRIRGEEKVNSRALPLFAVQIGFFAVIDLFYLLSEWF
jgi:putative membrane protein